MKTFVAVLVIVVVVLGYIIITKKQNPMSTMNENQREETTEPSQADRIEQQFGIEDPDMFYPDAPR